MGWHDKSELDSAVQAARDAMIESDIPQGRKGESSIQSGVKRLENEDFIGRYWFSKPNQMWHMEIISKDDGTVSVLEAPSMNEILSVFAKYQANQTLESAEIEKLNQADLDEEARLAENPYEKSLMEFMRDFAPHGEELATAISGLTPEEGRHLGRMIYSCCGGLQLPASVSDNIYVAYVRLIDNNSEFATLIDKGLEQARVNDEESMQRELATETEDRRLADEEADNLAKEEAFSAHQRTMRAKTEHECLVDMSKSPEGMRQLRTMATKERLSGVPTTPSTGTNFSRRTK